VTAAAAIKAALGAPAHGNVTSLVHKIGPIERPRRYRTHNRLE